ncbi:MAG: [FeFe] hydrogenase H-cluster radical SAM maturase HydG, partial [Marinilabiliales bacterium]
SAIDVDPKYMVSDEDFVKLIAILRLAVPYTGMILTARESEKVRRDVMAFGVSQIDGGTKLELGSYHESQNEEQNLNREQFAISDNRSLAEIIEELIENEYLPSFCTACYRLGRTGEHFMEFSVPGFIKRFCTPNAILTLAEYIVDYATPEVGEKAWKIIDKEIKGLDNEKVISQLKEKIEKIKNGERDLYF